MDENLRFSLIVPIFKTEKFLEKALNSIFENSGYENKEVICVLDGEDKKCRTILNKFGDKIKVVAIKHKGACAARNAGAKIATGDILSFFSSDFTACPGMIATWKRYFDRYPEADFIYGGYRLNTPNMDAVPSEDFDLFTLRNYPYIDGGMPIKRSAYVEWDENIKSLQDWDWWLSVVENGGKGQFIPEYTYTAEAPRPKGLSDDSNNHWIDRVNTIKIKHNIPLNDIVFCSIGAPAHAKRVAKLVGADYLPMPSFKPHQYKLIYLIGFYPQVALDCARVFLNAGNGCKKVVHWAGTDVWQLHHSIPYAAGKQLGKSLNNESIQFCEDETNAMELKELGFNAKLKPLPADFSYIHNPYPALDKFTVAVYDTRLRSSNDNECLKLMDSVTRAMPDVEFLYFAGDKQERNKGSNVERVGWLPMNEIIARSSMFLRFVRHDATSLSNIEFLCAGKPVLTNWNMPYACILKNNEENEFAQKEIVQRIREIRNNPPDLRKARAFYERRHDVGRFKEMLDKMVRR